MMALSLIIMDCMLTLIQMHSLVAMSPIQLPLTLMYYSRGFTSKNEKHVAAYLDHLENYLLDHKVESRVHALLEQAPTLSRKEIKHRYEAIDRDVTRGMVSSECKICKKQFKCEWSVALDQVGYCVRYWRTHYSNIKNHSSSPTALARLKQRAGEGILADLVGYSGLTKVAKAIVDGNFLEQYGDSVDMLPETTHLIMELAMPDEIWQLGKINHEVSTEDFYHGFQHWKESTSTSPSGRHLGHYKAIINGENYVSKRKLDFLEVYTKLVGNIPLKYGFTPE
jgi:hypothetical protein